MNESNSFEVIKSTNSFSIVKSELGNEYTYPKTLLEGSIVELKIDKIDSNGKIWFDTNIFSDLINQIITTRFLRKIDTDNNDFGIVEFVYNDHVLTALTPKWMMSKYFQFSNFLEFIVSHNQKLNLHIPDLSHPHYKYQENYNFKIISYLKEIERIEILDESTGEIYKAKKHFSQFNISINESKKFTFLGLTKKYYAEFISADENFLKPESILNDLEIKVLNENHLVDSSLRAQMLSQINDEDSYWIITCVRYFVKVVEDFIIRNRFIDAKNANNVNLKILGFSFSKNIFKSFPKAVNYSIKPKFELNQIKSQRIQKLIDFLIEFEIEDLFNKDVISVEQSCYVFQNSLRVFGFNFFGSENFLNILQRFFENIENQEVAKIAFSISRHYYQHLDAIFKNLDQQFFLEQKNKEQWVIDNKLKDNLEIINLFIENNISEYFFELSNQIFKLILSKNEFELSKIYKKLLKYFPEKNNKIEIYNQNEIKISGEFFTASSSNYSFIQNKDKIVIISQYNNHMINYFKKNDFQIDFVENQKLENILFTANIKFGHSKLCEQHFSKLKIGDQIDTVVKSIGKGIVYCTYYQDYEKSAFFETILSTDINSSLISNKTFKIGETVKAKVVNIDEDDPKKIYVQPLINPFDFDDFNATYEGRVVEIKKYKGKCPKCGSIDIIEQSKQTKIICLSDDCKEKSFIGATIFLSKVNKYIFINKFSIKEIHGEAFINRLNINDTFNFYIEKSRKETLKFRKTDHLIEIDLTIFNVRPSDILFSYPNIEHFSSMNIHQLIWFSFRILNELINKPNYNYKKESLINLNKQIGRLIKHPRTYVISILGHYNSIIEKFKLNQNISNEIIELNKEIELNYSETLNRFPQVKKLNNVLFSLINIDKNNYEDQVSNLNDEDGLIKTLKKLILIYNLVKSEEPNSNYVKSLQKKIGQLLERKKITSFTPENIGIIKEEEIDNDIELLKGIENKKFDEEKTLEFKETIKTPVLSTHQLNQIQKLKFNNKPEKIQEVESSLNIKDKQIQSKITMSTFKNICAMLNSNSGQIIIGVRDDRTLVGLESDYKLVKDYDGFQQYYDQKWEQIMCEPEKYRSYVTLKKVIYDEKEFCFITITKPEDFVEPCFINYNDGKNVAETCFIKANSTTKALLGSELYNFKRLVDNKKPEKNRICYVYIMKDRYDYKKIGNSYDPKIRGRTLMAQDDQIKVLNQYCFPNKDIALRLEKSFQNRYEKFNVNGEWYDLSETHLNELRQKLEEQEVMFSQGSKERNLFSN